MTRRVWSLGPGLLIMISLPAACARSPFALPAASPVVEPARTASGQVTFTAIADTSETAKRPPSDVEVSPPILKQAEPMPAYPARALEERAGAVTTVVRIVIGADGRVVEVGASPLAGAYPGDGGAFASDFRAAVGDAVRRWSFVPARADRVTPGEDFDHDGRPDYRKVVATEWIPVYVDLRFDFMIVEGKGAVSLRASPP